MITRESCQKLIKCKKNNTILRVFFSNSKNIAKIKCVEIRLSKDLFKTVDVGYIFDSLYLKNAVLSPMKA